MTKIAVDVVLLPSDEMMDRCIEINKELLKQVDNDMRLNKDNCFPHISLVVGIIEEDEVSKIALIMEEIAKNFSTIDLEAVEIEDVEYPSEGKNSYFKIQKTDELYSLHEEVVNKIASFFSYDAATDMFYQPPVLEKISGYWIEEKPKKLILDRYNPHITLGFGTPKNIEFPIKFNSSTFALFHVGKNTTCRKLLFSTTLR